MFIRSDVVHYNSGADREYTASIYLTYSPEEGVVVEDVRGEGSQDDCIPDDVIESERADIEQYINLVDYGCEPDWSSRPEVLEHFRQQGWSFINQI